MRTKLRDVVLLLLTILLWVSCAPNQSKKLYEEAVAKEYEVGMKEALPLYKKVVDSYSDSKEATQSREKIISYNKEKEREEEILSKRIEEEKQKLDAEKRLWEEEKRKQEENARAIEIEKNRQEAESRGREAEKLASYKLTESQAYEIVTNDCSEIKNKATFTISSRCDFTIQDVATFGNGNQKVAKISLYSKGFLYDISFTVFYGLIWNEDGDILPKLLQVREGRFSGLSDIAREFIKK